jgi:hypothetical protein
VLEKVSQQVPRDFEICSLARARISASVQCVVAIIGLYICFLLCIQIVRNQVMGSRAYELIVERQMFLLCVVVAQGWWLEYLC